MVLEEHEEGLMKLAHRRHQWVDDDREGREVDGGSGFGAAVRVVRRRE